MTGLKRKEGDETTRYRQTYIISVKITVGDRVTACPIVYVVMKSKSKSSYVKMMRKIQSLHMERSPAYGALEPSQISCDAEAGFIGAVREVFPTVPIRICSFHIKQAIRRRLVTAFQPCDKKFNGTREKIFGVIRAFVYSPFMENPALTNKLFDIIRSKAISCPTDVQSAVGEFIEYLESNWLTPGGVFGPQNWNFFDDILNGEPDTTNNTSESVNHKFGKTINVGYKAYKRVCRAIKKHKKLAIDYEANTVGQNRMPLRKKTRRLQMRQRETILKWFDEMDPTEQIRFYQVFLKRLLKTHYPKLQDIGLEVDYTF